MKVIIITILILVSGVVALNLSGRFFIPEVIQESTLTESPEIIDTVGVEKPAPFFDLSDLTGKTIKSSDFLGVPTIVTFWTTWNSIATDQIQILDAVERNDTRNLFKIVAISSQEDKSAVNTFVSRGGYTVDVLLDESGAITEIYQARSLPATYFLDKKGVIREVFIGVLSEKQLVEKIEKLFE